ncbi:MAG: SGNH/GDSL hydrolase family protein, partial [Myxococcales bacterium]
MTSFHRYVALGDSFTEGVGDPDPERPNGLRGWADRFAEALAVDNPDFGYANLAIRGRKLKPILAEQLAPALALSPDLVTIHAGANDVLRPKVDIDDLMAAYDDAIAQLRASGARVVMFTIFDPGPGGIYGPMRGRMAVFNEFVREIAERHDATIVDMWRMRDVDVSQVFDEDRMHLNAVGHQLIAIAALEALGIAHDVAPLPPITRP